MFDERRYLIIPTSITGSINFTQVHETSVETLRTSVDGAWTFVKYDSGSRPTIYSSEYNEYTYDEILNVLTGSLWNPPMGNKNV